MYVVVVQKFTFAISSPDEFLFCKFLDLSPRSWRVGLGKVSSGCYFIQLLNSCTTTCGGLA